MSSLAGVPLVYNIKIISTDSILNKRIVNDADICFQQKHPHGKIGISSTIPLQAGREPDEKSIAQ